MSMSNETTAKTSTIAVLKKTEFLGKTLTVFGTAIMPLFLAKEVAEWLEHSNARMMLQCVDDDEKQCVKNPYALKGQQEQWFLTEYGLYEVLMQSRKPIAKQFKKGVKKILKDIRQEGYYATPNVEGDNDWAIRQLTVKDAQIARMNIQIDTLLSIVEKLKRQQENTSTVSALEPPQPPALPQPYKRIRVISKSTINGKPLTMFGTPDNVLFIAKEVADWLSVCSVPNMMRYVSEGNKQQLNNPCSFSGRHAWFVTEKGLDELFERYGFYLDCNTQPFENGVRQALAAVRG